ncbi:MAG: hypothetical protein LKF31_01620 [Muribaculaceae bacterium]|jgi:hypothetical protein|nr:hypothetical protein [Muribaculaceae bacterium]
MKRKITLLICMFAIAVFANATDAYNYTFEDAAHTPTVPQRYYVADNSYKVIDNSVTTGIDNSLKCYTFETQSGIPSWGGIYFTLTQTTTTASMRYLYLKVRADASMSSTVTNNYFMVSLYNGTESGGTNPAYINLDLKATRATMIDQTWKEYCYEIPVGTTFDCIRVEPQYQSVFYVDDIRLSDEGIPNLKPFMIDFEPSGSGSGWTNNSANGSTYRDALTNDPFLAASGNGMRIWVQHGASTDFSGGRYTGVYGYTTESTRYLHVRYFYKSTDKTVLASEPLWVFTADGETHFTSSSNAMGQWNDVTIDLGVGTLVSYLTFTMEHWWITLGIDDIVLNGDPNSRNFTSAYQSVSIEPIVGERAISYGGAKATSSTTWFSEHYKLTFPGTHITWALNMPSDYTVGYSTTINGRPITGTSVNGANSLDLYGIKGPTTAQMTFTYTPTASNTTGSAFTETQNATLAYFGSSEITDNGVNIGTIGTVLYKNGEAVASVPATDNKTGGYVPSYYAPMKSTSSSDDATFSDYSNDVTPVSTDNTKKLSIIKISDMKAQNIYLMTPSFSEVAAYAPKAGDKLTSNVSVNYAVVPHYLMVTTGPYTSTEMGNIVETVSGTINTLQDSWTVSSAPALNLESVGKAKIKAVSTTADDLYTNATDVAVTSIAGATGITNHKLVTFVANALTPTGIEGVSVDAVSIVGGEGIINITGANNAVVYDFMGRMIKSVNNQSIINVPSGLYIVKAGGKVSKVKVD